MASLYKRDETTILWIKYRDPESGKIIRESTGCHYDNSVELRRARELEATRTLAETKSKTATKAGGEWDTWVATWITGSVSGRSQERYLSGWKTIRLFLTENDIPAPMFVTYQNCSGYVEWRAAPDIKNGKYKAGKNTAILEFKLFRQIMGEAVRRGFCQGNPAREVILKRAPKKQFSDIEDARLQEIFKAIDLEADPDQTCFKRSLGIASYQGVRLNETNVNPMRDVNLVNKPPTITFTQKGDRKRTKPIHPELIPLFTRLQKAKATETYPMERTPNGRMRWGNRWTKFLRRHGFKETDPCLCFHSSRVMVENCLREAGIEQRVREFYLSHEHGDDDVNARYDRVKIREMLVCHAPLKRPWLKL